MAGNSTNSPAWAQSIETPDGHASRAPARTASIRGAGPWPRRARGGRRESPSEDTMTHTLWWLIGVPSAFRASAISFTDLSRARIASTLSRRLAVLRGPLGPGLEETKNWILPARRSVVIWYIVAFEYPKRAPATSAGSPSTR